MTDAPPVPEVDDDAAEPAKEGIDLRKNGTIHVWIDGKQVKLRRPRARDFRKVRSLYQDFADELDELAIDNEKFSTELLAELDKREAETGVRRLTAEEKREDRQRARKITELTETRMAEWFQLVVLELGDAKGQEVVANAEELPVWLCTFEVANDVMRHWRSAPSLSGVR